MDRKYVDYAYDEFGEKVSMTTYHDINASGDVTRWLRDEATGLVTNKVYADGKGPRYDYTPDGKLATRIWARGIVTTYSYDDNGALTNTVYSDGTPTISLAYNRAGRQTRAIDAAGTTTFAYDAFGSLTNETVIGVAGTNTIERFYDTFGRNAGYALNGNRQTTLAYDPATGRLATMLAAGSDTPFTWNYPVGSDLKSSLTYPNGLIASWQYDANGQLLQVKNAFPTNTISQYDYAYDAAGRRISVSKSGSAFDHNDSIAYGYNARSELTNVVAAVDSDYRYAYDFDDIGNRETSSECGTNSVYTANNLNQYTAVDDFTPQFDDDGNQTLVKTATGVWSVIYNGENRPILWTCTQSNNSNNTNNQTISMSFDRMGRRVTKNAQRFVYDGYLQIANFEHSTSNVELQAFIWDPAERVATRPLMIEKPNVCTLHVTHDGNKNVSDLVFFSGGSGVAAHYEYAPFGAVTASTRNSASTAYDFRTYNSFRFSSEYADDSLGLVYYNYRHYEPVMGRGVSRDRAAEFGYANLYVLSRNSPCGYYDILGLADCCECGKCQIQIIAKGPFSLKGIRVVTGLGEIVAQLDKDLFWDKAKGKIKDKALEKAFKNAYDIVEKAKANAGLLEKLANEYSTLGHQFQPQCQYMSVVDIKRRDCVKRFFSKKCRWSKWEARKETIYSDWITPEQFKDTQTGQENWVAILDDPNPADVIDQMKKLMEKIKQNAQSELDKIDVATALSKQTGCEVVADLFAETEE